MAVHRGLGLAALTCIAAAVLTAGSAVCAQQEQSPSEAGGAIERMVTSFEAAIERVLQEAVSGHDDGLILEKQLASRLPARHRRVYNLVRDARTRQDRGALLLRLALGHARLGDVSLVQAITRLMERAHPEEAARLGVWVQGSNTIVRSIGANPVYADAAMGLVEGLRTAAASSLGIGMVERLEGLRMRVVLTVDPELERPRIWFDDSDRWHSIIRCDVPDEEFLMKHEDLSVVYGFAHAFADAVASWQDDEGAVSDYLAGVLTDRVVLVMRNQRWPHPADDLATGMRRVKAETAGVKPGLNDRVSRLALMLAVEDAVGRQELGRALDELRRRGTEDRPPGHLPVHRFDQLRKVLREHAASDVVEHLDALFKARG